TEILRDLRKAAHLRCRHAAGRKHYANPVQPGLLLRMDADMRCSIEGRARRNSLGRHISKLPAELLFDMGEKLLETPSIEHILQPRLVAIGAVAMLDIDADDGIGDRRRLLGLEDHAGVAGKIAMAGDATEGQAEIDT